MSNEIIETKEQPTTSRLWADRSEQIDKLAMALSKAQGAFPKITKESTNPFFKSKYADLANIIDSCRPALHENELCILQEPASLNGVVKVATTLMHSSGQYTRSVMSMPVVPSVDKETGRTYTTPHAYGSALTFLKRYSMQSVLNIAAEEDDDANAASVRPADRVPQRQPEQQQPVRQQPAAYKSLAETKAELEGKYIYRFPKGMEQHDRESLVKVLKDRKYRWDKANYQWYGSVLVPECAAFLVSPQPKPEQVAAPVDSGYEPSQEYYDQLAAGYEEDPLPW